MSQATQRIVEEEERAFPNLEDWDIHSTGFYRIGSPVSAEQMAKATDENVLKIFAELTDESGSDHPRHPDKGGARQAGQELAKLAETDAQHAVRLIRQMRPGLNDGPVGEVIRALPKAGYVDLYALIEELIDKGFASADFHREASHAIQETVRTETPVPDSLLDRMEGWLASVEPTSEDISSKKEREGSLLWGRSGMSILPSGNYPVLAALSRACLVAEPPRLGRWLDCLENHLERSESPRVWAAIAIRYLDWLRLADHERAQAFLDRLFQTFPAILQRHEGILFMAHLQRWVDPEHARLWLGKMEILGEMSAQGAGEILMLRRAWFPEEAWPNQRIAEWLSAPDAEYSPQRTGLAYSVAHLWSEPDHRQLAHAYLLQLMACRDPAVMKPLGAVHLGKSLFPDRATWEWLDTLCEHPALLLDQRTEYLIEHLETLVTADPARVARVCNVLLDEVGVAMRDLSTHWYLSGEPLAAIALALQDMGEPHRAEGVALFERMLEFNLPQAREMTLSLDKRMSTDSAVSRPRRKRLRPR